MQAAARCPGVPLHPQRSVRTGAHGLPPRPHTCRPRHPCASAFPPQTWDAQLKHAYTVPCPHQPQLPHKRPDRSVDTLMLRRGGSAAACGPARGLRRPPVARICFTGPISPGAGLRGLLWHAPIQGAGGPQRAVGLPRRQVRSHGIRDVSCWEFRRRSRRGSRAGALAAPPGAPRRRGASTERACRCSRASPPSARPSFAPVPLPARAIHEYPTA